MSDDKGQDDKILCVPHEDPNWSGLRELADLPDQLRTEIEHFFSIYKQPEGKEVERRRLVRARRGAADHRGEPRALAGAGAPDARRRRSGAARWSPSTASPGA